MIEIKIGDCTQRLKDLESNSVDSIISDPPYGLKYMEKGWDDLGQGSQQREWHRGWLEESYRVLKPCGVIKAFSGSRTFHNLISMMEGVGFRDLSVEAWAYGSGMPFSLDVAKALEASILFGSSNKKDFKRLKGVRREGGHGYCNLNVVHGRRDTDYSDRGQSFDLDPQTEMGRKYLGWGTSLKPSWEPICIGYKR